MTTDPEFPAPESPAPESTATESPASDASAGGSAADERPIDAGPVTEAEGIAVAGGTEPLPEPSPLPTPEPEPVPSPEPAPEPTPTPTPEPSPLPAPEPSPLPAPESSPLPTPEPLPAPEPSPLPAPEPLPMPEPMAEGEPPASDDPPPAAPDVAASTAAAPAGAEPTVAESAPAPAAEPAPGPRPKIGQSATAVPPSGATKPAPRPGTPGAGGVVVGRIVEVTIAAVHQNEVEVRLADGRIGVIPRGDFIDPGPIPLGATIEAALLARDDPKHRAVLSLSWARKQQAWEKVEAARAAGEPVTGKVTKTVKGGLVVDIGLRGFLPTSLIADAPGTDPSSLVGTEVEVLVMEVDRPSDRIVVSVRDLQRRRRRAAEKAALKALAPGSRASGRVVSIAEYGAVVDLGGVRGLVHRSELTWGRLERVEDIVSVGDQVEVVVLDVKSKKRISLSLRAKTPDPLTLAEVGSIESATVVRVVDYGVFAQLDESGAEGLVHITELSDVPGYRPEQLVTPGEQVMVKVLEVDKKRRRLSLSVRRVLVDD